MPQSIISERLTWIVDYREGSSWYPSKYDIHDCSFLYQEARGTVECAVRDKSGFLNKIIMGLMSWNCEFFYMDKSLVLATYQHRHSYGQDLIKKQVSSMDYKFSRNLYGILWHFNFYTIENTCYICMWLYIRFSKIWHILLGIFHIQIREIMQYICCDNLWSKAKLLLCIQDK